MVKVSFNSLFSFKGILIHKSEFKNKISYNETPLPLECHVLLEWPFNFKRQNMFEMKVVSSETETLAFM